jgi:hypothetical protein
MGTRYLKIEDIKIFFQENPIIHNYIEELIKHSISVKRTSFSKKKFAKEYEALKKFEVINRESEETFLLDYSQLPVSYVLTEIAEVTMQEIAPTTAIGCLQFANRFTKEIRKPEERTFWYSDLETQLESYLLIYLHQAYSFDVTSFIEGITEEMKDEIPEVRAVDMVYGYVFPYLTDNEERMFATITSMLSGETTTDTAQHTLQSIGKINPAKASSLYNYCKTNGGIKHKNLFHNILKGLYYLDESFYLNEAFQLFNENTTEGLLAIISFQYTNLEHIEKAFEFVASQSIAEVDFLQNAPTFYIRIIENKNTSEDIRRQCFKHLSDYAKYDDQQLRNNLVWRTGMIDGYDKEKYELLDDFMSWEGTPYFLKNYFDRFKSPSYLFELVKNSYLQHGMNVDMSLLKEALHSQYYHNPKEFGRELLNLLSDNIAIVRFAGVQVLTSRHGGLYEVDFLELDEIHQLRVIETLLPLPTNIEELMPLILTLRKSSFNGVKNSLYKQLNELIWAYDYNLIELVEKFIDIELDADKELLEFLNTSYSIYKNEKEIKKRVKELNPIENELLNVDLFYRLENEKNAELMEKAQANSIFSKIAKNVSVIRGSGFSSEGKSDISMMGQIGKSWLIDQRYSINPDKYEWSFRMNAIARNYKNEVSE